MFQFRLNVKLIINWLSLLAVLFHTSLSSTRIRRPNIAACTRTYGLVFSIRGILPVQFINISCTYPWFHTHILILTGEETAHIYNLCEGRCDSKVMLSLHDTIKLTFLKLKITNITFPRCTFNEKIYTENPLTLFDSFCNTVTTYLPEIRAVFNS